MTTPLPMRLLLCLTFAALAATLLPAQQASAERFPNGPSRDPTFFPLGVWLQSPHNATRYRDIGVNLYVGLYEGPTRSQLEALAAAGMPVICAQNEVGLAHAGATIVGWLQPDEPDNAQGRRPFGYSPPILPSVIAADYERMHRADPTRPVLLNVGQGAAWDAWHGRGERTDHPEDYAEYVKGCDIVSFDIYPVTHTHRDVQGKLEFVARGVQRLLAAGRGKKPVWACIETSHIDNGKARPSAAQVRSEVWIAICSGASGIVYFAHEFAPEFVEAGLLAHDDIAAAVRELNAEVLAQAPVLNTEPLADAVKVTSRPKVELALRAHRVGDTLHLFVASLSADATQARFQVRGQRKGVVHGAGADQRALADGVFHDEIPGYGHRHYRIEP
ncbi:MAG: beta-galactosidase [Planctomycetes bacterium]|nr:beta-galactosidase [Planctomycetota bacterium]